MNAVPSLSLLPSFFLQRLSTTEALQWIGIIKFCVLIGVYCRIVISQKQNTANRVPCFAEQFHDPTLYTPTKTQSPTIPILVGGGKALWRLLCVAFLFFLSFFLSFSLSLPVQRPNPDRCSRPPKRVGNH